MRGKVPHCRIGRTLMDGVVCLLLMPWVSGIAVADAPGTAAPPPPSTQTAPKPNLSWAIDPPASTWYLGPNQNKGAEFVLTVSAGTNITDLRVTHSTIADSDTGRGVSLSAERFHICLSNTEVKDCAERLKAKLEEIKKELNDAAGASNKPQQSAAKMTLRLVVDEDIVPDGSFTGNLFLDTEPITDTKTLQLTIQRTSDMAKSWGVVVILVGVILAWVTTVFVRARINRDQALLPVAVLQQKLQAITQDLGSIPKVLQDCVPDTQKALAAIIADLTTDKLDSLQLLPPSVPAISPSTTPAGALQTFLQTKSQVVDNLDVIVTGIKAAGALAIPALPTARLEALRTLVSNIDQLSASLPQPSDTLRTNIQALFNAWNAGPQAQVVGAPSQLLAMPDGRPLSVIHIRMEIQRITLLFWAMWGGLSVITGFIVLVMPNAGFGTVADYLRCFLWGFGLPVAGQGLQTLTMSSVNSQLGVTLPK
jgi:hypothetical protein